MSLPVHRATTRTTARGASSLIREHPSLMLSEPVALNNHPRTWPKDHRRDLQSRHRQLAATRSLSRPIITGTYSAKCSPLLRSRSFAPVPFLFFFSICPPSSPPPNPTQPMHSTPRPAADTALSLCYLARRRAIIREWDPPLDGRHH